MKRLHLLLAVGLALRLACSLTAADSADKSPPKEKSAADLAAEAFFKLRDEKGAEVSGARIQQIQAAAFNYLLAYPTHGRVSSVINALATYAGTLKDKKFGPLRDYWTSQLKYELINRRTDPAITDEGRTVLAAIDAALAGFLAKATPNRDNMQEFRGKTDQLAGMPGGGRFVLAQERDYIGLLADLNLGAGESQAKKLLASPDKKIAAMAQEELNILELRKQPLALKFTGLDGKETDVAGLRGKPYLLLFWDLGENSDKDIKAIAANYDDMGYAFNVVTVCVAPEADRAAVVKYIKDKRIKWPVWLAGAGNEIAGKFNAQHAPLAYMFDSNGSLASPGLRANRVAGEVRRLGKVK